MGLPKNIHWQLTRRTRVIYEVDVALDRLRKAIPSIEGYFDETIAHRSMVRSILTAGTIQEATRTIGVDHVYGREYFPCVSGITWGDWVESRARTILDIRRNGVLTPLEVFFDNSGEVYFHGFHRLVTSLEMGFHTIPVHARLLTPELADLAHRLLSIYPDPDRHTLYQPVPHAFFQLLPVQIANEAWVEKVSVLTDATRGWTGRVVEIGAHFGMLSRALRTAGVPIVATDILASYQDLQPLFESIGLAPIPYKVCGIQDLADEEGPIHVVSMGLMHHLLGNPDLWGMMQFKVLPWMQRNVIEMVVEMSLLPTYLGGPAAVVTTSDADVEVFWSSYGFTSRRILEGAMQRVTYHVTRR